VRLAAVLAATAVSYPLGLLVGSPWLLPCLNTLPAYLAMVQRLRAGDRRGAVVTVLAWALTLAVCGTLSFYVWPRDPGGIVLNGPGYREEMFAWICTGLGTEGSWRLFLPQHLLHLAAFVALCILTASALSILFGAVLMNYMSFYVASLARAGVPAASVVLFGWQPWAICRVAAFCVLGAVLAEPLLRRVRPGAYATGPATKYLRAAALGILLDWLLKASLAPTWGLVLRRSLCD
jgi:hypothetical protein